MLVSHNFIFTIDPVEQGLEELTEQSQVEDFTNLDLNQGKSRCIYSMPLSFNLKLALLLYFGCALSCRSCMMLITYCLTFLIILNYLGNSGKTLVIC
jgi:hypothetical protein